MVEPPATDELTELLEEVRRIEVLSHQLVTEGMAGGYASVFRGMGIEFDEVREYSEGDDPRAVDWSVTARTGRVYVKKFVDERELSLLFLIDLSPSMTGGLGAWSARQTAARVCACLALAAARNQDKVGWIGFADGVEHYLPPRRGGRHALHLIKEILSAKSNAQTSRLGPALKFVSRAVRRNAVVFVVSDFFVEPGFEDPLAACARRHDVIAVRLSTPELHLPKAAGLLRVREPETGSNRCLDLGHAGVRDDLASAVETHRTHLETILEKHGIDLMEVPVPFEADADAVTGPIEALFRARQARGGGR